MNVNKIILGLFATLASSFNLAQAAELNVYSHRQPFLIQPFLEAFSQKTGIKTNVLYSSKGLAQRLRSEGKNSPADVVLTVDIGRLYIYRDLNLLSEVKSAKIPEVNFSQRAFPLIEMLKKAKKKKEFIMWHTI